MEDSSLAERLHAAVRHRMRPVLGLAALRRPVTQNGLKKTSQGLFIRREAFPDAQAGLTAHACPVFAVRYEFLHGVSKTRLIILRHDLPADSIFHKPGGSGKIRHHRREEKGHCLGERRGNAVRGDARKRHAGDAEGNKVLTFTAGDDQYMSAVALLDYDKGSVVSKAAGSPEGAAKGASQNFTLSLNDSKATHLLLQVYDYAENYVTYKLNLNPDELAGDVTVKLNTEALTLFKGNVAKLTASVEPFGVQPDTVTWSSDNTDVATVSDNGLVTAVGKGTANITATSVKDPSVSATCVVTVDTIDVTLVGALRDKEGHPILFTWDMENDKTWTKYADLEQDINSATIDFAHDDGSMYQMNTSGLLYEVNPETGATVSASAAATKYGAPMQDMEYAAIAAIQSQKNILVGVDGAYFLYSDPVMANDFSDGWDMSSYLSTYANASEFTAVAWAGYTTNKAGHTVDVFYCLTDSGTIWIMMPDFETGRASMDWVDTDLKLSFPGYDGSLYCSMVLGDDGNLYLSYFTGETNEIYILKYNETTDSYESSLMGNIGNAVWPCSLLAVSDNHAEDGDADNNSLPGTELNVSSSIEAQSQTIEALTPASVTGSLNTANDAGTGAVKPADAETTTPVSSIAVSEDEKTVTVTVVPKNDDITTNGLFTVDYDASVLTLADVTFASQYSSHKDADGKVVELRCTYDPMSKGGRSSDGRKVKGVIHWVSARHAVPAEVRLFDRLFVKEDMNDIEEGKTFEDYLNPDSLKTVTGYLEPSLNEAAEGDTFQFERLGYFCVDRDSTTARKVFNRTVTLKDSWAKMAAK